MSLIAIYLFYTAGGTIWNPPALSDQQPSSKTRSSSTTRRKSVQDENLISPSSPLRQQSQPISSQTSETKQQEENSNTNNNNNSNNNNISNNKTIVGNLRMNNKKYKDIMKRIEKFTEIIDKGQQATTPQAKTQDDSAVEGNTEDFEKDNLIGCDYCLLDCDHECLTNPK